MTGEDLYKLLGELYALREKAFDVAETIATQQFNHAIGGAMFEFKNQLEEFDDTISEKIVALLKFMLKDEEL